MREATANREFADPEEREAGLRKRCAWLAEHPEVVEGAVGFPWAVGL